jgi:hypothetical protein
MECNDECTYAEAGPCEEITSADIILLFDMTGSHATHVSTIAPTVVSRLVTPLLDDGLFVGVASYGDFPIGPYGSGGDVPFRGEIQPVDVLSRVNTAIRGLRSMSGADSPESGIEALNVLTGGPVQPSITTPLTCDDDRIAGGCWREGMPRVIVIFTDAPNHNGPDPGSLSLYSPYDDGRFAMDPADWPAVLEPLLDENYGLFVVVNSTGSGAGPALTQHRAMVADLGQPAEHVITYDDSMYGGLVTMIEDFIGL